MFETTIAGSLPKPAWLAETDKLWPRVEARRARSSSRPSATPRCSGSRSRRTPGLDIVSDGEQSRQHFVHGFLEHVEGIDFEHKVKMGIRNNRYDAMVPQVVGPLRLKGRVHQAEARLARAHTKKKLKFTLPGPMTIVDTRRRPALRRQGEAGDGLRRAAQPGGARAGGRRRRRHPVRRAGVQRLHGRRRRDWGVEALERAAEGLTCTTACTSATATASRPTSTGRRRSASEWRQYEQIFPALAKSSIDQVSLECFHSHVPLELMGLLEGKDVLVGVIDVATDRSRRRRRWPTRSARRCSSCPAKRLFPCTNCGMAPMDREVAAAKLQALGEGAALARKKLGKK